MKLFQHINKTLVGLMAIGLFITLVGILALPSLDEWLKDSTYTCNSLEDFQKKANSNSIPEKDSFEESTEKYFSESATISYLEGFTNLVVNEFVLNDLPNRKYDVYTPPPKQEIIFIHGLIIG